ncbi:MAG: YraN family protein [Dehalococcoidales bacterium]|nr:YraN family protein [Dehalococcoidales bacterium]
MKRQTTGALGEKLAAAHLAKHGYRILDCNYRVKEGEVDIVAMDGACQVFIEVRTKTSRLYGTPEESITRRKKEHMIAVAHRYREKMAHPPLNWRIDLVAIEMDAGGKVKRLSLIQNAVEDE